MEKEKLKGVIESILFTMGGAVELTDLARALDMDPDQLRWVLCEMREDYKREGRGIGLIELENSWQMATRQENYEYIRRLVAQPKKRVLTDVLMETLSIIAYKQPVTRQEIENIRGVKCDFAVNKLMEYQLVRELGRLDTIGHPIVFGTTEEFLRCFGVASIDNLPDIDEVKKQDFLEEAEMEIGASIDVPT